MRGLSSIFARRGARYRESSSRIRTLKRDIAHSFDGEIGVEEFCKRLWDSARICLD